MQDRMIKVLIVAQKAQAKYDSASSSQLPGVEWHILMYPDKPSQQVRVFIGNVATQDWNFLSDFRKLRCSQMLYYTLVPRTDELYEAKEYGIDDNNCSLRVQRKDQMKQKP